MRPFSALMERLRLRPQSAGGERSRSEGGVDDVDDEVDANQRAALSRNDWRAQSLRSVPVSELQDLNEGEERPSNAPPLAPLSPLVHTSAAESLPRGASVSYKDMLAFLDREALQAVDASVTPAALADDSADDASSCSADPADSGSASAVSSHPFDAVESPGSRRQGSEGGTSGLRHFKSIKVSHSYLRGNSMERQRGYTEKTDEEKAVILEGIRENILFQNCPREMLQEVILAMRKVHYSRGKKIIKQGDAGDTDFFVLVEGVCEVKKVVQGQQALRFQYKRTPQAFGELALLYSAPRAASITAVSNATCWVLNSRDFNGIRRRVEEALRQEALKLMDKSHVFSELDAKQKIRLMDAMDRVEYEAGEVLINAGQTSSQMYLIQSGVAIATFKDAELSFVAGDAFGKGTPFNDQHNSPAICASGRLVCYVLDAAGCDLLADSRQQLYTFSALSKVAVLTGLSDEQLHRLVPLLETIHYQRGSYVIREGELGDAFYIIESGSFVVERNGRVLADEKSRMCEGDSFGGASLLDRTVTTRTADVRCVDDGTVLRMAKADFVANLGHLEDIRNMWHIVALRRTKLFSRLPEPKLLEIAAASEKAQFRKGDLIVKQGERGDKFYIIEKGTCEVIGTSGKVLNRMDGGTPFGEAALLGDSKRTASVQVVSEHCSVLSLQRSEFHTLLGNLKNELQRAASGYVMDTNDELPTFDPRRVKWVKAIGTGAYAVVYLGWWRDKLYAIKTVNKAHMLEINQVHVIIQEKQLLQGLRSNFCVQLVATAQDSRNLYLMMQPILGGELFTLVAEKLGPLPEDKARFYAACTVLGLEYLHDNNILYRDLKLENLLIDSRGYLKIADLGIAKRLNPGEKTYTFKGTPDYMAPEYLNNSGVTHAADWWAVGVLIFEINSGYTPFQADEPIDMFRKIVKGTYTVPSSFSPELVSLLSGLLERRVAQRLGSGVTGSLEVKQHPWFSGLNWAELKAMKLPAPWLPELDIRRIAEASDVQTHPVSLGKHIPAEMQVKFADF